MGLLEPKHGPRCAECPLFSYGIPVQDRVPMDEEWTGLVLVGEQPGAAEVERGLPFVGPSGRLLEAVCKQRGRKLETAYITNCIRCGSKGGRKLTEADGRLAMECCREILLHTLKVIQPKVVCAVGAIPWESLSGKQGIDKWRGTVQPPIPEEPWWLMATLHPAGLLRVESRRILVELMFADIDHAFALASGEAEVWEPVVVDTTDWCAVEAFIHEAIASEVLAVDVETDGIDSLTCNLLTVGIALPDRAISLPWPDAFPDYWTPPQREIVEQFLRDLWQGHEPGGRPVGRDLVFHNKSYDVPVLRRHLGEESFVGFEDTLLLHHACYPKLPHTLEQVTSQMMLTEPWKTDYNASDVEKMWGESEKESDDWTEESSADDDGRATLAERSLSELLWYNATDAHATIRLHELLTDKARHLDVLDVYQHDNELMDLAIDWHRDGIGIDIEEAVKLAGDYKRDLDAQVLELGKLTGFQDQKDLDLALAEVNHLILQAQEERRELRAAGWEPGSDEVQEVDRKLDGLRQSRRDIKKKVSWQSFNPGSPIQVQEVLNRRSLIPTRVTAKTFKPSTSKTSLWDLRGDEFVELLLRWREKHKTWSTYLAPMGRKIGPDQRIHPVWKLHSTPSGRFGATPGPQNWPGDMKELMVPSEGCVIVGADYAAVELRIVALLSGEPEWLDVFQHNGDLHATMAYYYFPEHFPELDEQWLATPGDEDAKNAAVPGRKALRNAGKPITFGDIYLAGPQTLYEQIRLERPDVQGRKEQERLLREVTAMQRRLRAATPTRMEWARYQQRDAERNFELRTVRWIKDEIMEGGRIRKWPMGEASPNECANHPIQGGGADIMNAATRKLAVLLKSMGLYRNGVWIILQIHDALYLEVEDVPVPGKLVGMRIAASGPEKPSLHFTVAKDMRLPEFAARLLEQCMFTRINYISPVTGANNWMEFPAEAKIRRSVGAI
jgi:uracil-DNA glycosylase family 4